MFFPHFRGYLYQNYNSEFLLCFRFHWTKIEINTFEISWTGNTPNILFAVLKLLITNYYVIKNLNYDVTEN